VALIIETGAGVPGAESYISVEDADQYHSDFGNTEWAPKTLEEKEIALRKGTQYLDVNYSWYGDKTNDNNALEWPRTGVSKPSGLLVADNVIPEEIRLSCAEAGLKFFSFSLLADILPDDDVKREKIAVIEVEYNDNRASAPSFTVIDKLVAKFAYSGNVIKKVIY
jgi:hypothetical protein